MQNAFVTFDAPLFVIVKINDDYERMTHRHFHMKSIFLLLINDSCRMAVEHNLIISA